MTQTIKKLYKYKSKDKRNLNDLLHSRLWVSRYYYLNDASDLQFSLSKQKLQDAHIDNKKASNLLPVFYQKMYSAMTVISFSKTPRNLNLWGHYADGFFGFVIEYDKQYFERRLQAKIGDDWADEKVTYKTTPIDMTKTFIEAINASKPFTPPVFPNLFTKSRSWIGESEIRYSLGGAIFKKLRSNDFGTHLLRVKPSAIYVGFKNTDIDKIKEYCQKKNIPCYICMPDFYSQSNHVICLPSN